MANISIIQNELSHTFSRQRILNPLLFARYSSGEILQINISSESFWTNKYRYHLRLREVHNHNPLSRNI